MEELISIIIPVFNAENYLEKCIDSVVNQTYSKLEIILIDDGSTDNSGKICDEWKEKDKRIKVIHKENGGVSSARNVGLDTLKGEYIGFVDPDDYIDVTMYEKMYNSIIENLSDISICNFNIVQNDVIQEGIVNKPSGIFLREVLDGKGANGFNWNKLYKKSLIGNVRFDNDIYMWEDLLFNFEIIGDSSAKYSYIDDRLYNYVQNESSAIHSIEKKKGFTSLKVLQCIIPQIEKFDRKLANEKKIQYILNIENLCYIYRKCKKEYNLEEYRKFSKKYIKEGLLNEELSLFIKLKLILAVYFSWVYQRIKKRI